MDIKLFSISLFLSIIYLSSACSFGKQLVNIKYRLCLLTKTKTRVFCWIKLYIYLDDVYNFNVADPITAQDDWKEIIKEKHTIFHSAGLAKRSVSKLTKPLKLLKPLIIFKKALVPLKIIKKITKSLKFIKKITKPLIILKPAMFKVLFKGFDW